MSTCFRTREKISFRQLLDNLPDGIRVDETAENNDASQCLTDGTNWVWAYTGDGTETSFSSYGRNYAYDILDTIAQKTGVEILSEHHPEFEGTWDD